MRPVALAAQHPNPQAAAQREWQRPVQTETVQGTLLIEWRTKEVRLETRTYTGPDGRTLEEEVTVLAFSDGVTARYGPTVLKAEFLEVRYGEMTASGFAKGNVLFADPEGEAQCEDLIFDWRAGTAEAHTAKVRLGPMDVRARRLSVSPKLWVLEDAELDPNAGGFNLYSFDAQRVIASPGRSGSATRLGIRLFGKRIVVIPKAQFSLQSGRRGLRLPSLSFRDGEKPGISWESDLQVGERWLASASMGFFSDDKPSGSLTLTYDLMGGKRGADFFEPRSELSDPFPWGYFDNIGVRDVRSKQGGSIPEYATLSVSGTAFQRIIGREKEDRASKPLEFVADFGGNTAGVGHQFQLRYQDVDPEVGERKRRTVGALRLSLPPLELGGGFEGVVSADVRAFIGGGSDFAWGRLSTGVVYSPVSWVSFGVAYVAFAEKGDPLYGFDRIWPGKHWSLRTDVSLGPRSLSYVAKYDPNRKSWFDHEIALRQIAGSVTPYLIVRQFPSRFTIGVELRTLEILKRIGTRYERPESKEKPQTVLSGG